MLFDTIIRESISIGIKLTFLVFMASVLKATGQTPIEQTEQTEQTDQTELVELQLKILIPTWDGVQEITQVLGYLQVL